MLSCCSLKILTQKVRKWEGSYKLGKDSLSVMQMTSRKITLVRVSKEARYSDIVKSANYWRGRVLTVAKSPSS